MRTKQRLTITLPQDLITQIDILMDRQQTANRSQTIEGLLKQVLPPQIDQAVILAGGVKSKSQLLTDISGQYLLSRVLVQLSHFQIKTLVICTDPDTAEQLKAKFGSGQGTGVLLRYSIEPVPLGTSGALVKASTLLDPSAFLVLHGDVSTELDIKQFIDFHLREGVVATMAVKPRLSETKFGQVFLQGNKIIQFNAGGLETGIAIVNTGLYLFDWEIFKYLPKTQPSYLEQDVFPLLAKKNALAAYFFQGFWADVSDAHNLNQAVKHWSHIRSRS